MITTRDAYAQTRKLMDHMVPHVPAELAADIEQRLASLDAEFERALTLELQNAAMLAAACLDKLVDLVDLVDEGQPEMALRISDAATVFTVCEPDAGDSYEWILAMDDYAEALLERTRLDGRLPDDEMLSTMALAAIAKHGYSSKSDGDGG